jgi:phage baseplate assembly protein gpV
MRRRLLATSTVLAGLLVPAGAQARDAGRFVLAAPVDGPSDIQRLGDLDVARDGTGGLVYVRRDAGVDHVYLSRLAGGAFQPPDRLDATLTTASSQPVVAAGDNGSLVLAYISGGSLFTIVRPDATQPFTAPQLVSTAASNPSIDLSVNGVAYVSFTVPGGGGNDVVVARKDRGAVAFEGAPGALDIDPARDAGAGTARSRVAVAADGVALVVWGEADRVFARRVFGTRLSAAPQDATADLLGGFGAVAADAPDVDVEDDSSFAWVVYRERLSDGQAHAVARRLRGGTFDDPVAIDGQGFPAGDSVGPPRVAIDARGNGYGASATTATAAGAVLHDDVFNPGVALGPTVPGQGFPVPAVDESGDGLIAWQNADFTIHARHYDNDPASRVAQTPQGDTALSSLAGGSSDAASGLEAAANRLGDVAVAFVQGAPGARSIMVASFDRVPGAPTLNSGTNWRNVTRAPLRWSPATELWGPVTYRVEVDGRPVGQTTDVTQFAPPALPDGVHRWRVVAVDRIGQENAGPPRVLRHDGTPPRVTVRVSRSGRVVGVAARPTDASPAGRRASGVKSVRISFGDGASVSGQRATHRYRRTGPVTLSVSVRDRADNITTVRRRITIR